MSKRALILLAVVWAAALGLVGFAELRPGEDSGGGQERVSSAGSAERAGDQTGAGDPERGEAMAKSGSAGSSEVSVSSSNSSVVSSSGSGGPEREGVTLRIEGEEGLEFSGRCVVDGEEREISGQAPETYSFEPDGRLECEITSREQGTLRVTFSDGGGTNTTQQIGPGPGTLELTYTGDGLSVSTSSQTSSSSSSQVSSSG